MSICCSIQEFGRKHEVLAGFFSLLAVVLLFATVWLALQYHMMVLDWLARFPLLHLPVLMFGLVVEGFLIIGLLALGAERKPTDLDCFRTFRGRRGGGSPWGAPENWMQQLEQYLARHQR